MRTPSTVASLRSRFLPAFALACIAQAVSAQVVFNFNDLPSTARYSVSTGFPIGSTIFAQGGVPVRLTPYGTGTTGSASARPPSQFPTQNLWISNIGTQFDLSALNEGRGAGVFRFQWINQGGSEMIAVNGSPQFIGLYDNGPVIIGGASLRLSPASLTGARVRTAEIRGYLQNVTIGGQEYSIDNVEILPPECPCRADFDGSGGTPDITDINTFFNAWSEGADAADINCSGGTPDGGDIERFFRDWLAGGCRANIAIQDFERVPVPTVWSTATGFPPESTILEDQGIRIRLLPATLSNGTTVYGSAAVTGASSFQFSTRFAQLTQTTLDLDFTRLPFVPSRVVIEFQPTQPSMPINLSINGSAPYIGVASTAIPTTLGGVSVAYLSFNLRGNSLPGRLTLTGPVQRVRIGSPEACLIDNISAD